MKICFVQILANHIGHWSASLKKLLKGASGRLLVQEDVCEEAVNGLVEFLAAGILPVQCSVGQPIIDLFKIAHGSG